MTDGRPNALQRLVDPIGWFLDKVRAVGLEGLCGRYYGMYDGVVTNTADQQNRGRIQATCPALGIRRPDQVGNLWMTPCLPGLGLDPTTKQITGNFHPPDVGTTVWIQFEHGDKEFPVYMGGYLGANKASDTFDTDAGVTALRKGIRTKTGHFLRLSDDPDDLHIMICKGDGAGGPSPVFVSLDKTGSVQVENQNGSQIFMNAETPEISLLNANDQQEVVSMLVLGDDVLSLVTKSGGGISVSGKNVTISAKNLVTDCDAQVSLNAGTVLLGKGAAEPAVRGNALAQWAIQHGALGHLGPGPVPGTPCTPGAGPPILLGNQLSTKVFIA